MKLTKNKLQNIIKETLAEARYGDRKIGYGSGSLEADLSDELAMLFCMALDEGMTEAQIDLAIRTLQSCRKGYGRR